MKINRSYSLLEAAWAVPFCVTTLLLRAARNVNVGIFVASGLMFVLTALMMMSAALERRSYRSVPGRLISFDADSWWLSRRYRLPMRADVLYSYTIDGTTYYSRRINLRPWSFRQFCGNESLPDELRAAHASQDQAISVFVRKDDVECSVLTLDVDRALVVVLMALGAVVLGLVWLIAVR